MFYCLIYTTAIWPENQKVDIKKHPYLGVGEEFLREIRIAPKKINFSMGYWIYENKVAFISSKKECFGFIIESKEFTEMMSSQHEAIWKISKTISVPEQYTKKFLNEIKNNSLIVCQKSKNPPRIPPATLLLNPKNFFAQRLGGGIVKNGRKRFQKFRPVFDC